MTTSSIVILSDLLLVATAREHAEVPVPRAVAGGVRHHEGRDLGGTWAAPPLLLPAPLRTQAELRAEPTGRSSPVLTQRVVEEPALCSGQAAVGEATADAQGKAAPAEAWLTAAPAAGNRVSAAGPVVASRIPSLVLDGDGFSLLAAQVAEELTVQLLARRSSTTRAEALHNTPVSFSRRMLTGMHSLGFEYKGQGGASTAHPSGGQPRWPRWLLL